MPSFSDIPDYGHEIYQCQLNEYNIHIRNIELVQQQYKRYKRELDVLDTSEDISKKLEAAEVVQILKPLIVSYRANKIVVLTEYNRLLQYSERLTEKIASLNVSN